jgi:hypothetical protein
VAVTEPARDSGSIVTLLQKFRAGLRCAVKRFAPLRLQEKRYIALTASANPSLRALTAAALALPGLTHTTAQATEGDEATFQYGRHEEGARELFGVESAFDPIQVDSLHGAAKVTIFDRLKFAFNYVQDTWSGATPIATAPLLLGGNVSPDGVSGATPFITGDLFFDSQFNPVTVDAFGQISGKNTQLVHTLSSASPETRKQGDFRLSYEWDEAVLDLGGGISLENDYESRWGSLGGRWDLNQKLTSLSLGLSYTESDTQAILDHDAAPYIDKTAFSQQIEVLPFGVNVLHGKRKDWTTHLSLTQILNKNALIEAGFGYTRGTGFMENPYKVVEVAFIDPNQQSLAPPGGFAGQVRALLEQRPDVRNQWTWDARYAQYFEGLDAALHFSYRFFHDDWGINAHTFEADWGQPVGGGWTITPRIRYYSQDAADFYQPFLISKQAYQNVDFDPETGEITFTKFDPRLLPADFSSDHRLSGYGALSGGVTVEKEFARGVSLEAGFEYYTHQSDLQLGGEGREDYTDFDYWTVNAALKVDLAAPFNFTGGGGAGHHDHAHHAGHTGGHAAPAGVMYSHMLPRAGDFMVGYRYMYHRQGGDILHRSGVASDADIIQRGCGDKLCKLKPADHSMHMHMFDLMYAPTDWLNLMLMPQFVDMEMSFDRIDGAPPLDPTETHHAAHSHSTGGVGDTWMFALVKLWETQGHHLHASLGLSAPTGEVDLRFRRNHGEDQGFIHYHMQLGSGTWDLLPSLTYTGQMGQWSWGGQLSGAKRLEQENDSGYSLGDMFQATAWGGYSLTDWLAASVRGVYTTQGAISGKFTPSLANVEDTDGKIVLADINSRLSPVDLPANYGGRYWDIGFGLTATVPFKGFEGNQVSVEWLQPIEDDVNGFQLEREGTLSVTWSLDL